MNNTNQHDMPAISDVLYELSIALDEGSRSADVLDDFIKRFPQYASDLTEYAVEAAIYTLRPEPPLSLKDCRQSTDALSPAVSRGISRFQNRLHALRRTSPASANSQKTVSSTINPFASLDKKAFRALATGSRSNNVLISKLRDRLIDPKTIKDGFVRRIAEVMGTPIDVIWNHLNGPAQANFSPQFYKSDEKPQAQPQQTFEQAVRESGLSIEDQKYLLGL